MENYIKMRIAELTLEMNNASMDFEKLLKQRCIGELKGCLAELKKHQ